MSKAGRVVRIQSHLEAVPTHTMQCFELPTHTSREIDKCNYNFFGKTSASTKGMPLISWDRVSLPKKKRGLGLRKTEATNKAFHSKLAWKILTDSSTLWATPMRLKYLPYTDSSNIPLFDQIL